VTCLTSADWILSSTDFGGCGGVVTLPTTLDLAFTGPGTFHYRLKYIGVPPTGYTLRYIGESPPIGIVGTQFSGAIEFTQPHCFYSSAGPDIKTGDYCYFTISYDGSVPVSPAIGGGFEFYNNPLPYDETTQALVVHVNVSAPAPQTITFPAVPDQTLGAAPVDLAATASSGLSVSYSTQGPCTV